MNPASGGSFVALMTLYDFHVDVMLEDYDETRRLSGVM